MMETRSVLRSGCQPAKRKTCIGVVILAVIIGSILFAYQAFGDKPKDTSLKKVFIVFRHGDRTPTETYPNDPYLHYEWPNGWGSLTKKGMAQLYRLGEWIREEFGWLTDYKYSSTNTIVNSSYSDRCIMSTQALLAALYPPGENSFHPGLNWQPIPVHYVPRYLDKILVVAKSCPRLENALKEAYANESLKSDESLKSYYEELEILTGQPMKTVTDVEFLYNTLEIEVMNGLKLPPKIEKLYSEPTMRRLASISYTLFTSNTLQQRLRGGPLLKHILDNMKSGSESEKIHLYGTHDVNIVNTLRAMGFTNELFKLDLGVSLIYELRYVNGDEKKEVRISMLNNTESTVPHKLRIPGCEDICYLDDLIDKIWKDVLPEDWEKECQF